MSSRPRWTSSRAPSAAGTCACSRACSARRHWQCRVTAEKASTTFTEDMAIYGATLPVEKRFYRQALEELSITLTKAVEEKVATQSKINEIETENTKAREVPVNILLTRAGKPIGQLHRRLPVRK